MNNSLENESTSKKELSLFDMFLVLVKYRKLIILGTLISLIVFICVFKVLPEIKERKQKKENVLTESIYIRYKIDENVMPYSLRNRVLENFDSDARRSVSDLSMAYFTRDYYIADLNKKFPVFSGYYNKDNSIDYDIKYNSGIMGVFKADAKGKTPFVVWKSSFGEGFCILLKIRKCDVEIANKFVDYIVNDTEKFLENHIIPKIQENIEAAEYKIMLGEKVVDSDSTAYSVVQEKAFVEKANAYLESFDGFIKMNSEPFVYVYEPKQKQTKRITIMVIGVFMILVILSYILNAISNLKKDPESVESFKSAWKAGKFSKK